MKYKAVALDLDGTLLGSDLNIRNDVAEAIRAVRGTGVRVLMATGRHHTAAMPYHHQLALDTPLICCNGTYAWDARSRQALMPRPLLKTQAHEVLRLARKHGVHTLLYVDNAMTYEVHEPHLERLLRWASSVPQEVQPAIHQIEDFDQQIEAATHIWKFAVTATDLERIHAFGSAVARELGLSCEWSAKNRIDIAQSGNSKGRLLTEWLEQENISPDHAIAFGDSPNDMSMLSAVGLGVAMEHAIDTVRSVARMVTGSNDSPAIASVLATHILGTSA